GEDDEEMAVFLNAMKSKSRTKTWENDDDSLQVPTAPSTKPHKKKKKKKKKAMVARVEVAAVHSKKAGGSGILLSKSHVKFGDASESTSEDEPEIAHDGGSESDELYDDFFEKENVD